MVMHYPGKIYAELIGHAMKRRLEEEMNLQEIKRVDKLWGFELWIVNTDKYCGKELFIGRGQQSSKGRYHFHKIKDETFYVIKGNLNLDYADERNIFHSITLKPGQGFRIKPGIKHKFSTNTLGGCKFVEFSTKHREEDSYRCEFINGEWVEYDNSS